MNVELMRFKADVARQTAALVADMRLQAVGVDLSTPGGMDLARSHAQQLENTAETQALKQHLAREEFHARAATARLLAKLRK